MGYLQEYNQQYGGNTPNITPSAGGYLKQYETTQKTITKPTSKPVVKPTTQPVVQKQSSPFQAVTNIVKKISDNIKFTFTAPKIASPIPQDKTTVPVQQKPVTITPDQTKLSQDQIKLLGGQNAVIKPAPKQTVWQKISDKVSNLFDSTESQKARAMNAYAVQKRIKEKTGKELDIVKLSEKGGNVLKNTLMEDVTKELGIRDTPTTSELTTGVFTAAIALGLASAPVATLTGIGIFSAVNKLKSGLISAVKGKGFDLKSDATFSDLFENAPADVKNIIDIVDFLVIAKTTHKVYKTSPKVFEKLTKDVIVDTKAPTTINLTKEDIKKINLGLGDKYTSDLVKSLDLSGSQWKKAVQQGLNIEFSTEKLTRIVDKPYWRKIKSIVGAKATNIETKGVTGTKSKEGFAGYLTDGEQTPQQVIDSVIKSGQENTKVGKEVIKAALEAQKTGQNIIVEKTSGVPEVITKEIKTREKIKTVSEIPGVEKAGDYVSAKDFADAVFSAKETDQIGKLSPENIIARDSVDEAGVQIYVERISEGKPIYPVEIIKKGDKFITTDESHRVTAYKLLNQPVPVIYRDEGKIEELSSFKEIYNEAKPKKPIEEKITEKGQPIEKIPSNIKAQVPVGEGQEKPSMAYSRVRDRLATEAQLDVNYNTLNLEQDAKKAVDFITKDPKRAIRVALGLEKPPTGQTETAISIALADKAGRDGDFALQSQLEASRSLRQTRRGQEIVSERGRFNDDSPYYYIRDLMDRRLKNIGSNLKTALSEITNKTQSAKKAAIAKIDEGVAKLKEKLKKDRSKIKIAQDIIDSLRC